MVELVDEAFGGLGTVTAPTHEQEYGFDPTLVQPAIDAARAEVEGRHAVPEAVDPSLRGRARTRAVRAHAAAVRERGSGRSRPSWRRSASGRAPTKPSPGRCSSIRGRSSSRRGSCGPRSTVSTGTSPRRSAWTMVRQLEAADPRGSAEAHRQGTFHQHGQRAYRFTPNIFNFNEPRTVPEATALLGGQFRRQNFRPTAVRTRRENVTGGFEVVTEVDGTVQRRGQQAFTTTMTLRSGTIPDNATMIQTGQAPVPEPRPLQLAPRGGAQRPSGDAHGGRRARRRVPPSRRARPGAAPALHAPPQRPELLRHVDVRDPGRKRR